MDCEYASDNQTCAFSVWNAPTMTTPTRINADMLKDIARALGDYKPRQSLLMSAGYKREVMAHARANAPSYDNPLFAGYTQTYMGLPVETFYIPPEEVIDWSGCRSPSRAKRRHARGIPQRIKIEYRERAYIIDRDVMTGIGAAMARDFEALLFASIYAR